MGWWISSWRSTAVGIFVLFLSAVVLPYFITENVTSSLPRGLYIRSLIAPESSPFITFPLPESMRPFFIARGDVAFFDNGGTFIKRVGAVAGDEVCVVGDILRVNGVIIGKIRTDIPHGELLPHWLECRRLEIGEILPLADAAGSIDGRNYGPIQASVATGYRELWRY